MVTKRKLIEANKRLLEEKKELLRNIGLVSIKLNETRRIHKNQVARLYDKINNPIIYLPSGNILKLSELNESQLEYLESLANENTKKQ